MENTIALLGAFSIAHLRNVTFYLIFRDWQLYSLSIPRYITTSKPKSSWLFFLKEISFGTHFGIFFVKHFNV